MTHRYREQAKAYRDRGAFAISSFVV